MNNELIKQNYEGEEVVFKIENGVSYVRINEVAKFCGWSRIANSGNEVIRWDRVKEKLELLGVPNVGYGDFIPESIMYPLIGMADMTKNTKARDFMMWVGQVLTEIRATGKYDNKEHEIMKIEDEEERKLTLAVYKLEELYKIDNDELSAMRLENKKNQLQTYKQSRKIAELENKVKEADNKVNEISDKISKATVLREGDMSAEIIDINRET